LFNDLEKVREGFAALSHSQATKISGRILS